MIIIREQFLIFFEPCLNSIITEFGGLVHEHFESPANVALVRARHTIEYN